MSDCLVNCSNNGICFLNETIQKYLCECFSNFSGPSCNFDSRPCSKYPCLNNGTCLSIVSNEALFKCECKNNYYGVYCENKFDLCLNQTCSGHGYCFLKENLPSCKCKNGFNGENCEIENLIVKFVRGVQITSILLCSFCILLTIFIIVSNDIWNMLIPNMGKVSSRYRKNSRQIKVATK